MEYKLKRVEGTDFYQLEEKHTTVIDVLAFLVVSLIVVGLVLTWAVMQ